MPRCNNCGRESDEVSNFCPNCGAPYVRSNYPERKSIINKNVPSDVSSYLTADEDILKTEKSEEWEIYVTNKRVLFKKGGIFGKELVEASYRHISSIEYKKASPLSFIIAGICLVLFGFIQYTFLSKNRFFEPISFWIQIVFILLGIVAIVASLFIKPTFKIHVVGREPLTVSGKLEEIIKIIRQYKEKVET